MSNEEIEAYVKLIEDTPIDDIEKFMSILPNSGSYNIDINMSRICDALKENINLLRQLNEENDNHDLDDEILTLLKKLYLCIHYLDDENEIKKEGKAHRIVFAKTSAGNPYFLNDLKDIPTEAYGEVKKVLGYITDGVDMSDDTKCKFVMDMSQKILEFKGFQVRIYTTKLKDNILCVVGIEQKKANWNKKNNNKLKQRLIDLKKQLVNLRKDMNDVTKRDAILLDSENVLDDVMDILGDVEIEFLFPSDEDLISLVPYDNTKDNKEISNEVFGDTDSKDVISISSYDSVIEKDTKENIENTDRIVSDKEDKKIVPSSAKKVKKRTRGLGKKTILRNEINTSLKGLSVDELKLIQEFINKIKQNKELEDTVLEIYDNFLNMTPEQISGFEASIKNFKHDDIGRSK